VDTVADTDADEGGTRPESWAGCTLSLALPLTLIAAVAPGSRPLRGATLRMIDWRLVPEPDMITAIFVAIGNHSTAAKY